MHVRDRENKEKFPWLDADIKYFPISKGSIKKTDWMTPAAREMGLGPTMFLMTQKAFLYLFIFYSVISIPLMILYAKGGGPTDMYQGG